MICRCQGYPSPAVPQSPRVQTDVALPPLQKLAPSDSRVKERLFVVFKPLPLPMDVLEDVFWYEILAIIFINTPFIKTYY